MSIFQCEYTHEEAEYDTIEEAKSDGWYESPSGHWYSPTAIAGNFICDRCGEFISTNDDYSRDVDGDNKVHCRSCAEYLEIYWCEHCGTEHYDEGEYCRENVQIRADRDNPTRCSYEETWCQDCASDDATWNEEEEYYYYETQNVRIVRSNYMNRDVNRFPEGAKPELCEQCKVDGFSVFGECANCLRNRAYNKELRASTLWVFDDRFETCGWYHPGDHNEFKGLIFRDKHEHPFLYYGIEVEVSFDVTKKHKPLQTIAKEFIEITKGLFVAESDSSIDCGIEFISRPTSFLKWESDEVQKLLRKGFKYLKDEGAFEEQPRGNGIHIHMSRKFFENNTKRSISDINQDLDWIFQFYKPEVEIIANREYTRYCMSKTDLIKEQTSGRYFGINREFGAKGKFNIEIQKSGVLSGDSYHHAVITRRNKTFEVRAFRSSVDVDTIMSYIEFARNIAHTVRSQDITGLTLEQILASKESKYLDKYIDGLRKNKSLDTSRKVENKLKIEEEIQFNY